MHVAHMIRDSDTRHDSIFGKKVKTSSPRFAAWIVPFVAVKR